MERGLNNNKYEGMGTKVSPAMAEVLDKICEVMQVDIYHLLQWFCYTIIRASSPHHELSPEIQKIMTMLETDAGWQRAFNLCNPDGLDCAQVILILQQKDKKGFGAVMIDKPFMGAATQTECVDDILERVCQVTMRGIYRKLREMGAKMDCRNLSDVLLTMIDAQSIIEMDEENRREMAGPADIADNGRAYAYGKKTKARHHRTPDSIDNRQQVIRFDDTDREVSDTEAAPADNADNDADWRPFDVER